MSDVLEIAGIKMPNPAELFSRAPAAPVEPDPVEGVDSASTATPPASAPVLTGSLTDVFQTPPPAVVPPAPTAPVDDVTALKAQVAALAEQLKATTGAAPAPAIAPAAPAPVAVSNVPPLPEDYDEFISDPKRVEAYFAERDAAVAAQATAAVEAKLDEVLARREEVKALTASGTQTWWKENGAAVVQERLVDAFTENVKEVEEAKLFSTNPSELSQQLTQIWAHTQQKAKRYVREAPATKPTGKPMPASMAPTAGGGARPADDGAAPPESRAKRLLGPIQPLNTPERS